MILIFCKHLITLFVPAKYEDKFEGKLVKREGNKKIEFHVKKVKGTSLFRRHKLSIIFKEEL